MSRPKLFQNLEEHCCGYILCRSFKHTPPSRVADIRKEHPIATKPCLALVQAFKRNMLEPNLFEIYKSLTTTRRAASPKVKTHVVTPNAVWWATTIVEGCSDPGKPILTCACLPWKTLPRRRSTSGVLCRECTCGNGHNKVG